MSSPKKPRPSLAAGPAANAPASRPQGADTFTLGIGLSENLITEGQPHLAAMVLAFLVVLPGASDTQRAELERLTELAGVNEVHARGGFLLWRTLPPKDGTKALDWMHAPACLVPL